MGSKESMVTAPVMVLVYDVAFEARGLREALSRRKALYLGLASTWLLLAAAIFEAPRFRSAGLSTGTSPWTYLLNQTHMIVTYLKLSIWPHPLVLDYGPTRAITVSAALPYLVVVVALAVTTLGAWRKHRALAFLGVWFFVTLAPSSSVVPIATEVGAERRMYLPLAAVVLLLVLAARAAATRWRRRDFGALPAGGLTAGTIGLAAGTIGLAAVTIGLGALTVMRNAEYRSATGIWESVLARRPHGRAHYNLGIALKEAGRTEDAVAHYRQAVDDEPAANYALGFELGAAGRFEEAVEQLRAFIRRAPEDFRAPKAYFLLGQSLAGQGRRAEAAKAFRETLRMVPRDADARGGLADVLLADQRHAEAIAMYRDYLTLMPRSASGHHNLGVALMAQRDEAVAAKEFQLAVELSPTDANLRLSLGNALVSIDRLDDAIAQYRAGLRVAPDHTGLMSALALTLDATGRTDESLALFQRALQLEPDNPDIRSDYEAVTARRGAGR